MEIVDIETFPVGTPEPHDGGTNWVFVKVITDDGTVGYGECNWTNYRPLTIEKLVHELKDKFVTGLDPFQIETLRNRLYNGDHFLHVPGALQATVISGIEMACWDIVGKVTGQPVYNLLGGKHNDRVRTYSYIQYEWGPPADPAGAGEAAKKFADAGFTALKLDPLHPISGPRDVSREELNYAESVVREIREAVGDRVDILFGTHGQLNTHTAIRLAKRLEQFEPLWFEEPVPPEKVEELARVNRATSIPVAAGERITTKHKFAEILEAGAADVLQVNVGLTGILESKKIAGMAETHYAQIAPWVYCGPIAAMASVHVDACSPNFLVQEGINQWDGFYADILEEPIEWEDGDVIPPDKPGLGVELDEEVAKNHPLNEMPRQEDRSHYSFDTRDEIRGIARQMEE